MQSALITNMQKKDTKTENGMTAHSTSNSACVDFFFNCGAMRDWTPQQKQNAFIKAYNENPEWAIKTLFYSRDVRHGQGERQLFRDLIDAVPTHLLNLVPEYGRWDDLFYVPMEKQPEIFAIIKQGLQDVNGLCAKWMPRQGPIAKTLRDFLGYSPKEWRKLLVNMTKVVEQKMCAKEWTDINYGHVPSQASKIYRNAFKRHDAMGYTDFLTKVEKGKQKINAGAIHPHEILVPYTKHQVFPQQDKTVEALWKAQPNYLKGTNKLLPVCDVSGSMEGLPLDVCVALGIYISERNEGPFKDAFITFSDKPQLEVLKGNLLQRVTQLKKAHWEMNTNLEAVFDLILNTANKNKVAKEDMPETVLIMSDMQFDQCTKHNKTAIGMIKQKYKQSNYDIPKVVFWNLRAVASTVPAKDKEGVALVSGFSPSIMKSILEGEDFSPTGIMLKTILSPRYENIKL
jgi:hypothetical protein